MYVFFPTLYLILPSRMMILQFPSLPFANRHVLGLADVTEFTMPMWRELGHCGESLKEALNEARQNERIACHEYQIKNEVDASALMRSRWSGG